MYISITWLKEIEMNKESWIYRFLSHLKVFVSSPPPELDESHAATRYRVAYMTREEWQEWEQAKFQEACDKEATDDQT